MNNKKTIQKNTRFIPNRFQASKFIIDKSGIFGEVNNFLSLPGNNYLGFGGIGDLILLLASCYDDPHAKLLFFANDKELATQFVPVFVKNYKIYNNIFGSPLANAISNLFFSSNYRISAHLPDGLDQGDWIHEGKYISRIKNITNWKEKFGTLNNSEKILIIVPSGSQKEEHHKRFLTSYEHSILINNYLNDYDKIYSIGSNDDLENYYGLPIFENCFWLNTNSITDYNGTKTFIDISYMFKIINSSKLVISMDTWVKSYTSLININTKVIKTKDNGIYKSYGNKVTDYIFLNPKIWESLELITFEELIK